MNHHISVTQRNRVLAQQTCQDRPLPGVFFWDIVGTPAPGPATWSQVHEWAREATILSVINGRLIVRRPNGLLAGVLWTNDEYSSNWLKDARGNYTDTRSECTYVDGSEVYRPLSVAPIDKPWWKRIWHPARIGFRGLGNQPWCLILTSSSLWYLTSLLPG